MSNKIGEVLAYNLQYPNMTIKAKKSNEHDYNLCLMQLLLNEYEKGYIFKRINKPTKLGTNIRFIKITDWKDAKEKLFKLGEYLNIKLEVGEK